VLLLDIIHTLPIGTRFSHSSSSFILPIPRFLFTSFFLFLHPSFLVLSLQQPKKQEELRKKHEWVKSVISRAAQYHRLLMVDFEALKAVHDWRTASSLRAYGYIFLTVTPGLLGPFVHKLPPHLFLILKNSNINLSGFIIIVKFAQYATDYGLWAGIYSSVIVRYVNPKHICLFEPC